MFQRRTTLPSPRSDSRTLSREREAELQILYNDLDWQVEAIIGGASRFNPLADATHPARPEHFIAWIRKKAMDEPLRYSRTQVSISDLWWMWIEYCVREHLANTVTQRKLILRLKKLGIKRRRIGSQRQTVYSL